MISKFHGPFDYTDSVVSNWPYSLKGVYYCGNSTNGVVKNMYIGRSTGDSGIRGRLLDHLREDSWQDVTLFWYRECGTDEEAIALETSEIQTHQPKYNTVGRKVGLFVHH